MKKEEYREILSRLPIENPTPEDMAQVCPHLTQKQAVKAFNSDSGYVACPSLRIRHAFQIVSYRKGWTEEVKVHRTKDGESDPNVIKGTKEHPPRLDWSYASRTPQSYADGRSHGDVFSEYQYMQEAMKFAEKNWRDELILDDWQSVMTIYVQDPSELVNDKYHHDEPKTKRVLYLALNREYNDFINDHSVPQSEHFDNHIVEMTLDPTVYHELKGGRGGYTNFNCAYCGAGLGLSGCSGCGHTFRDNHSRCGWYTPLSPRMVQFLKDSGHVFKQDPTIALDKEKSSYEEYRQKRA